jgi:predicted ATPase
LARAGGLASTLWAGPAVIGNAVRSGSHPVEGTTRADPISLQMAFASGEFCYLIDLGIPSRDSSSAFNLDPKIKRELIWSGPVDATRDPAGRAQTTSGPAPQRLAIRCRLGDDLEVAAPTRVCSLS